MTETTRRLSSQASKGPPDGAIPTSSGLPATNHGYKHCQVNQPDTEGLILTLLCSFGCMHVQERRMRNRD